MSEAGKSLGLTNGFAAVGVELKRRTTRPCREFVYWCFFILCTVVLGSVGIWVEWMLQNRMVAAQRDWNNVYTSFVTFFPALIGSSCMQMIFESSNRRVQAFSIVVFFVALITGAVLISTVRPAGPLSWLFAVLMSTVSLWVWWVANADNTRLHDVPPDDAPLGGDPTAPLSGGFGSVKV